MQSDLVVRFGSPVILLDHLEALVSICRSSQRWERFVVAMDWRERPYLGIRLRDDADDEERASLMRVLRRGRVVEADVAALLAEPLRWREIYVDGGWHAMASAYNRTRPPHTDLRRRS